jgi:hypothetical protein
MLSVAEIVIGKQAAGINQDHDRPKP